jgi:hypothetical protein
VHLELECALDASTLLFLTHIRKIEYSLPDSSKGCIERNHLKDNRIEILVQQPNQLAPTSRWFLRFDKTVRVKDYEDEELKEKSCRIAVAFGLTPAKSKGDADTFSEWGLMPIEPGRVFIYFPAEKETSNLHFHLHAPFASTVGRDSVRECVGNNDLRDHLADLLAESMPKIRDQRLLNVHALALLPNDRDNLSNFYRPLMDQLVKAFKENELVPMKRDGDTHAAAKRIFRGPKVLSDLINDDDLVTLLGGDYSAPIWAANPPQRNQREDNFLSMLGIEPWETSNLVKALAGLNKDALSQWMRSKDAKWHQALYSLLHDYLNAPPHYAQTDRTQTIRRISLVRCSDEIYRCGCECFFPSDGIEHDDKFPRVAIDVYSNGSDNSQKKKAKAFLHAVGVQELDEVEYVIKTILSKYRPGPTRENAPYPTEAELLAVSKALSIDSKERTERLLAECRKTPFIKAENAGNKKLELKAPGEVWFVEDQGLRAYLQGNEEAWFVHQEAITALGSALGRMGARTALKIYNGNGRPGELIYIEVRYSHKKRYLNGFDPNFDIEYLKTALLDLSPSKEKSTYIWIVLLSNRSRFIKGIIEECNTYGKYVPKDFIPRERKVWLSIAGQLLRKSAWIPNAEGVFCKPSEVHFRDLPQEWNSDEELARALGVIISEREDIDAAIKDVGFDSLEEAKELAKLKKADPERFRRWWISLQAKPAFPVRAPAEPNRRRIHAMEKAARAPVKLYNTRERSVRTSRTQGKADVEAYLRDLYTNDDHQLICQICHEEMPFRKKDGKHYFEKVEAFDLPKEHNANHLALCPVCAAKYDEFVLHGIGDARGKLRQAFCDMGDALELPVTLGKEIATIRFVESHAIDLHASTGAKSCDD